MSFLAAVLIGAAAVVVPQIATQLTANLIIVLAALTGLVLTFALPDLLDRSSTARH